MMARNSSWSRGCDNMIAGFQTHRQEYRMNFEESNNEAHERMKECLSKLICQITLVCQCKA